MNDCSWPFHANSKDCESCQKYESLYGESLTRYMDQMAELKAAQRAEQAARRQERTLRGANVSERQV